MSEAAIHALLVGRTHSTYLRAYLERRGCLCAVASCAEEGTALFQVHRFRLILSMNLFRQARRMAAHLEQTNCSVFCAVPVESGCWWVPILQDGRVCFGASALRPREFTSLLDRTLQEMRGECAAGPRQAPEADHTRFRIVRAAS